MALAGCRPLGQEIGCDLNFQQGKWLQGNYQLLSLWRLQKNFSKDPNVTHTHLDSWTFDSRETVMMGCNCHDAPEFWRLCCFSRCSTLIKILTNYRSMVEFLKLLPSTITMKWGWEVGQRRERKPDCLTQLHLLVFNSGDFEAGKYIFSQVKKDINMYDHGKF